MELTLQNINQFLASHKFPQFDKEETRKMALELGFEMSDEELAKRTIDIRDMYDQQKACKACTGLDSCPLDYKGIRRILHTVDGELVSCVAECEKLENVRYVKLLKSAQIPKELQKMSIKEYDIGANAAAVEYAKKIIMGNVQKGMYLHGPVGAGKTHLAMGVLNNIIRQGKCGIYICVPDFIEEIRHSFDTGKTYEIMSTVKHVPYLVLDDIDKVQATGTVLEKLFSVFNSRSLDNLTTISTGNRGREELVQYLGGINGEAIVSRMVQMCEWFEITGRDRRQDAS